MIEKQIFFNGQVEEVRRFVDIVDKSDMRIELVKDDEICCAKSIMGILCFDLSKPLTLRVHADQADELLESIDDFIVVGN